mmetsp:Transcript_22535/g.53191  ORF Transcript_22535/g.53191 Transcript_22535/m.53191 type:complete len:142 (+) Transcript_22535:762-1187(+)
MSSLPEVPYVREEETDDDRLFVDDDWNETEDEVEDDNDDTGRHRILFLWPSVCIVVGGVNCSSGGFAPIVAAPLFSLLVKKLEESVSSSQSLHDKSVPKSSKLNFLDMLATPFSSALDIFLSEDEDEEDEDGDDDDGDFVE